MIEEWKVFAITYHLKPKYKNVWEVSTLGRVRRNGILKTPKEKTGGYLVIKNKRLHRIVAETFIPNPDNKPCVDHIDGDKKNNSVSNLRWVTHKENNNNPITKKRQIESQKLSTKYQNRKGWNYDHRGTNNSNYKTGKYVKI